MDRNGPVEEKLKPPCRPATDLTETGRERTEKACALIMDFRHAPFRYAQDYAERGRLHEEFLYACSVVEFVGARLSMALMLHNETSRSDQRA